MNEQNEKTLQMEDAGMVWTESEKSWTTNKLEMSAHTARLVSETA